MGLTPTPDGLAARIQQLERALAELTRQSPVPSLWTVGTVTGSISSPPQVLVRTTTGAVITVPRLNGYSSVTAGKQVLLALTPNGLVALNEYA